MTNADKTNITHLRERGFSYGKIAEMLNLSKESISSYCKRHGLGGRKKTSAEPVNLTVSSCLFCGGIVEQIPHRKAKKFCSDACRMKWWNLHSSQIERKSEQAFLCPVCGKSFSAYASSNQKYCSRKCYGKSKEAAYGKRKISESLAVSDYHGMGSQPDE